MEHRDDLGIAHTPRQRWLECIRGLIRIEGTEFMPEYGFVVDIHRGAPEHVIDEVERAAEVRIPRKPLGGIVAAVQLVDAHVKVVSRQELGRGGRGHEERLWDLSSSGSGEQETETEDQRSGVRHSASFSSSSAMRCSSSATRFFKSGR